MQLDRVTNHITDVLFLFIDINVWAFLLFSRFGIVEAAGKSVLFRVSEDLLLDRRSRVRQATEHGVYLEGSSPSDFHHLSDWTNDSRTTRL